MKKMVTIVLILSLLFCAVPAMAELSSADVAMNGNQYHISLESVEIKDGKLYVALNGMAQTMAFGPEGIQLAAEIVPVYGEERLHASDKDILFGADVTYRFDRDTLPDFILMIPTQDAENPITLWENPDEDPAIPDELVGQWRGTGMPKGGGPAIDLTARIDADGTGEYTFDQSDYHESYPFTISSDDSTFSVDIPADNALGISACGGSWALEGGVLKLDITTTFASGGSYSYTAECEKVGTSAPDSEPADLPTSIATGDIVTFGRYEQDGDDANGPEPIEWIILTQFGNRALLLSRDCLDAQYFNDDFGSAPWESCSLRSWLNDAFLKAAFTEEEQARIFDTTNANTMADGYPGLPANSNPTTDRVFLLSYKELMAFAGTITIPGATAYAEARCNPGSGDSASAWWLRSPGPDDHAALVLYESGELNYYPADLNRRGVRPALTVNLEN